MPRSRQRPAPRWIIIAALALSGCGQTVTATVTQPAEIPPPRGMAAPAIAESSCDWRHLGAGCSRVPASGSCHYRRAGSAILPDPDCTPGLTSPAVSSSNVARTVCVRGYTARVRPPTSYTTPLKHRLMAAYGVVGPSRYELDHLVPLEAGGAPADPGNLWPEPYAGAGGARVKDLVENYARAAACATPGLLDGLRAAIAANWAKVEPPSGQ